MKLNKKDYSHNAGYYFINYYGDYFGFDIFKQGTMEFIQYNINSNKLIGFAIVDKNNIKYHI